MDFTRFYAGDEFEAYKYLGAHIVEEGVLFRTYAPNAARVALIGEFCQWAETPMSRVGDGNFWECLAAGAREGQMYKYRIYKHDGTFVDHCDPYGFYAELRPKTASIVYRGRGEDMFRDESWMRRRSLMLEQPMNIYEIHAGSWRCKPDDGAGEAELPSGDVKATKDGAGCTQNREEKSAGRNVQKHADPAGHWYHYRELATCLIPYLKENHYNYVEFMPLSEHPSDASWGYQSTGFFSPTARYGTPDDLRFLINLCHENDIGVIMDFVPVHFAVDGYALAKYDGSCLYEYPDGDMGRSEWGSCNFWHSKGEVRSFLQSSAYYWLTEFHFDGLRMDAVSRLIYWQGEESRGVNRDAVSFVKTMNEGLKKRVPEAILIAEDSTNYPGVTRPVSEGGLGFDYKWDLGWMNDTLSYFQSYPYERVEKYHKLTFSMMYFYNERYLLPLSHDEVVHGKATILQKMNGEYEGKFPQARAFYMYMMAHPGKKLNFMGNEIGQLREWDERREQDWDILHYPVHDAFHHFMRELNRIYLNYPALSCQDYTREGFLWLDCHQEQRRIYAFERLGGGQRILAIFNFSDQVQKNFILQVGKGKEADFQLLLSSDALSYGGSGLCDGLRARTSAGKLALTLAPFSGLYLLEADGGDH